MSPSLLLYILFNMQTDRDALTFLLVFIASAHTSIAPIRRLCIKRILRVLKETFSCLGYCSIATVKVLTNDSTGKSALL
jgi:hypothetical protein